MKMPTFYDEIKNIVLTDPLAQVLGSADQGTLEFSFKDVVKFAGHGCPTVAGAYLMAFHGLKFLYGEEIPVRGNIEVHMKKSEIDGTTGVVASVISSIVGAAGAGGFKGLGGLYSRNNALFFFTDISSVVQLKRKDNGKTVNISYHPEIVPGHPETSMLMSAILEGVASNDEKAQFQNLWNERLKRIIVDQFNNPQLVRLSAN